MPGKQEPRLVAADGPYYRHAQATGQIKSALITARERRYFGHWGKVFARKVRLQRGLVPAFVRSRWMPIAC
jgi:hypothetical protein